MGVLERLKPRRTVLKKFFVLDVETGTKNPDGSIQFGFPGRPETFIFGVIHGHNYTRIYKSLDEMKAGLLDPIFRKCFLFGHNVTYDLNTIFGNIFHLDPEAIFNGGRFMCCNNINGNGKFADSANVLGKIPLKKIGEMIGKQKPSLGDENMFSKHGLTPAVINRCVTDCEITYDALQYVFNGAGDVKITGPSLALSNFRRYFMPRAIQYSDRYNKRFFDSYYGGRTEAFKIGHTHSAVIDVNSMYPYIMRTQKFPNPRTLIEITIVNIKDFTRHILPHKEGQITATVYHHPNDYGFLPVKKDDKLIFPVGLFMGTWCFPEIRNALEKGAIEIRKIHSVVCGDPMPTPFKEYVDFYYRKKVTETNAFEIDRVKHLLNDLYGKFGQKQADDTVYIPDMESAYTLIWQLKKEGRLKRIQEYTAQGKNEAPRKDGLLVLSPKGDYTPKHSIPCIAAYITSAARVHLLNEILKLKDKRVTYCDTDSIFFELETGIESSKELGGWKLESKKVVHIRGLKNYSYYLTDDETGHIYDRIKGVPKKAIMVDGEWFYENLSQTKEALNRGLDAGVPTKRRKGIKGTYDKRLVLDDGETLPIIL